VRVVLYEGVLYQGLTVFLENVAQTLFSNCAVISNIFTLAIFILLLGKMYQVGRRFSIAVRQRIDSMTVLQLDSIQTV
jgi:hypothetical protein